MFAADSKQKLSTNESKVGGCREHNLLNSANWISWYTIVQKKKNVCIEFTANYKSFSFIRKPIQVWMFLIG